MSDTKNASAGSSSAEAAAPKKPPIYAPFFRMIGMPNFRFRLPSRNWTIFLTIVGSWSGAVWYDRREKKRILQKWCDAVSHLRSEPLQPDLMRRKLLVVLAAPPADGLLSAREHFHEYVRPILVAGGMDWEAVEGRKEGDVRAQIAERIRDQRRRKGETGGESTEEEKEAVLREMRERLGVGEEPGIQGDMVIGRHTWKEYIRGLHEGWLGPLEAPKELIETPMVEETPENPPSTSDIAPKDSDTLPLGTDVHTSVGAPKDEELAESENPKKEEESKEEPKPAESKLRKQPPPFISTDSYSSASLPTTFESDLGPSVTVTHPHILGLRNTGIRIYRFLNRRLLADEVGKQVAAAVLAANTSYKQVEREDASSTDNSPSSNNQPESRLVWEQEYLLEEEESGWHKSVRKQASSEEGKERVWLDPIVLDSRIASRMRKFEVQDSWESKDP